MEGMLSFRHFGLEQLRKPAPGRPTCLLACGPYVMHFRNPSNPSSTVTRCACRPMVMIPASTSRIAHEHHVFFHCTTLLALDNERNTMTLNCCCFEAAQLTFKSEPYTDIAIRFKSIVSLRRGQAMFVHKYYSMHRRSYHLNLTCAPAWQYITGKLPQS
jgi:hypothetical protein